MADYQSAVRRTGAASADIDAGLRAYMNKIYSMMGGAMAITAVLAYVVGNSPAFAAMVWAAPMSWIVMFSPLGLILVMSFGFNKLSAGAMQVMFWAMAVLMGLSASRVFLMYGDISIAQTFLVTCIAFLSLSLYGYTTKRNLSGFGSFLMMGLVGLIGAMLLNFFLQSSALMFAINVIGVLIFAGLIAFDTQRLKNEYIAFSTMGAEGAAYLQKGAVMGALSLYLNFYNLFMFLLSFMGGDE